MSRVTITYECGCKISPFIVHNFHDGKDLGYQVHGYDVDMEFCEKHDEEFIEREQKLESE